MKMYLVSLAVGVVVGAFYALVQVRSPAPPIIALLGLLGMVAGERFTPLVRDALLGRQPPAAGQPLEPAPPPARDETGR